MAEKKTEKTEKKKKSRRAYLESFQKNQEGNYEYKGELYVWQGTGQDRRRELARLWGLCIALLGSLAGAGSVDAPGAINCAYVILPYVINLIAGISVCWGLCRLSAGGNPVRAYVWKASVEQIPGRAVFACISGGVPGGGTDFRCEERTGRKNRRFRDISAAGMPGVRFLFWNVSAGEEAEMGETGVTRPRLKTGITVQPVPLKQAPDRLSGRLSAAGGSSCLRLKGRSAHSLQDVFIHVFTMRRDPRSGKSPDGSSCKNLVHRIQAMAELK